MIGTIGAQQQPARGCSFDPDVGCGGSQTRGVPAIHGKAELAGKVGGLGVAERLRQGARKADRVIALRPERGYEDVAPGLNLGRRVQQVERGEAFEQGRMGLRRDPAQLQIGPRREVNLPIAKAARQIGNAFGLRGAQPAIARANAHNQPIAGFHRAQGPRTPAFDLWACRIGLACHAPAPSSVPSSAPSSAAIELRRVSQSPASRSLAKRSCIAASAPGFSRARKAVRSSRASVAS